MPNFISEDQIERAAIALLKDKYGYRLTNCYTEDANNLSDKSDRNDKNEVVLFDILCAQIKKINPNIPEPVINQAIEKLTARRYSMSQILANKEIYNYIRDGVPIDFDNTNGKTEHVNVKIIDFNDPLQNDFLTVTQLWIKGDIYNRRPNISA